MNRIKNKIKRGFTVIPNDLISDISISSVARFLFIYMASKPDDWDFYQTDLMKATGIKTPRTFRIYAKELIETGWISRDRTKTEGAKFSSYNYTLNEKPGGINSTMEPGGKKSTVEKNHSGKKAPLTNKDFKQRNTYNKEIIEAAAKAAPENISLNSSPEIKERKKVAAKKERKESLPYRMWVVWASAHEQLHGEYPGQEPKHFKHLQLLSKKFADRIKKQGMDSTEDAILENFGIFLSLLSEKGDQWYLTNFTPDIFNSKFQNIIQLLKRQHNEQKNRANKYEEAIASFAS